MIEFVDVSVNLGEQSVLKNLSFRIQAGETLCLVGHNGSGKSTLLKLLIRQFQNQNGDIYVKDTPLSDLSQKALARTIGYVPQNPPKSVPFTVKEFLKMGRFPYQNWQEPDEETIRSAARTAEIQHLFDRRIQTLSGGELRKIYIAGALVQEPDLLLFDEPTTFLDPRYKHEVLKIIQHVCDEENKSVLVVTHDLNEVVPWGDRILALKDGQKQFLGTPDSFYDANLLEELYGEPFQFAELPRENRRVVLYDSNP